MPELPEVEVTRLGLLPHITGRRIVRAVVRHHGLRWPIDPALPGLLAGLTISRVLRRGKYLLIECMPQAGQGDVVGGWLLIHLGMTGTLRVLETPAPPGAHDHVDIELADATGVPITLRYRDPRRFGAVLWHPGDEAGLAEHQLLRNLGIEPFDARFDGDWMYTRTRGRRVAVKSALLAGDIVVGVGNIYCSESLFRAGIRPTTAAGRISRPRYAALAEAIRATLADAIARGGSTLRDFVGSDGQSGYFQLDAFVYDRAGLPCRVCGTPIRQIVQGQRSTFYCPACQR
ncbi:Formamidopyrimidine-DNA glycosylase [Ralstonia mannitolilytica]|uniref:bifunctional DNA-formamidopyrimidine glycosylase/DNA-(apurinic or apyrimidinic site) lyase n=1 Tax=Ralstonia mannitolilytica TaxID=105219 RepID=UPI0007B002B6|nr:bifunctional DNA-formamidopyrimidine glycosylase/DNA-(apurinic or apyrimidinic site) lyase [Ralstonia mannitolilytica]ANA33854.1 formamidopyrimidine-DNA glycosylase [Ralstonia mannitolilytica]CAJ0682727.1 Formamidopyrimidine-DNA glycosylase [Ralstonia mannitolilytica]CAJ0850937.1 Formamidopyrimidine-DNA glycosylase [Ralstonia mannitolilytica]